MEGHDFAINDLVRFSKENKRDRSKLVPTVGRFKGLRLWNRNGKKVWIAHIKIIQTNKSDYIDISRLKKLTEEESKKYENN